MDERCGEWMGEDEGDALFLRERDEVDGGSSVGTGGGVFCIV